MPAEQKCAKKLRLGSFLVANERGVDIMCQTEISVGRREIAASDDSDGPPKGKLVLMLRSTHLKVPPMRFTCAILFSAFALLSCLGKSVCADQVDDLLAGKPVKIDASVPQEPATSQAAENDSASVDGQTELSVSQGAVPQDHHSEKSWELTLAGSDQVGQGVDIPSQSGNKANHPAAAPTGAISLVPEPSAIALAAAALVYFLIFFRRRYSF